MGDAVEPNTTAQVTVPPKTSQIFFSSCAASLLASCNLLPSLLELWSQKKVEWEKEHSWVLEILLDSTQTVAVVCNNEIASPLSMYRLLQCVPWLFQLLSNIWEQL